MSTKENKYENNQVSSGIKSSQLIINEIATPS